MSWKSNKHMLWPVCVQSYIYKNLAYIFIDEERLRERRNVHLHSYFEDGEPVYNHVPLSPDSIVGKGDKPQAMIHIIKGDGIRIKFLS